MRYLHPDRFPDLHGIRCHRRQSRQACRLRRRQRRLQECRPLPNPSIDAKAIAGALRNVGFQVVEGTNLTRDKMTERLLDFGKKAQGADVAVFFYAGHGIAISGTNYLLPIDADIKSEMDVKLGAAINIDLTLEQTMGDAKVKLVFLDACRDNPFAAKIKSNNATRSVNVQTGLAEMKSGEGTLIAFATGPGQTALDGTEGGNSPFTRALLANITQPGVEIQQAMTKVRAQVNEETSKGQLPWGHTNLIGSVYLNGTPAPAAPGAAPNAPAVAAVSPGLRRRSGVLAFDQGFQQAGRASGLPDQLSERPVQAAGAVAHCGAGERQGGQHSQPVTSPPASIRRPLRRNSSQVTEDQIGLDKGQRRDVQRRLNGLGFDTKVTGVFNESTRSRDQALAGRARLHHERLSQQAAAQGAVDRDRGDHADRELQRRRRAEAASPRQQRRWRRRRWWRSAASASVAVAARIPPAPAASSAA